MNYSSLIDKQDSLTFDNAPTAGSLNPVTSDGVQKAVTSIPFIMASDGGGIMHQLSFGYFISDALYFRIYIDGVYQKSIRCLDN